MNGKQLKNSILQWAIQGKLVPQDPNDESASVLLERIRAEKARLVKEKKIKKDKNESIIYRGDDNSYYEKFLATGEVKCIDDEIPFEIPVTWEWVRLNSYSDVRDGTHDTPQYVVSGYPLITSKDFIGGIFDFSKTKYIDEQTFIEINKRSNVQIGDILFSMIGGNIGSMILITKENYFDMAIKNVALFKQYIYNDILIKYLYFYLQSQIVSIKNTASGGAQSFVPLNMLRNYLMPIPPLNEQKRIIEKFKSLDFVIQQYEKSYRELNNLKQELFPKLRKSILQEAIQGKLVSQIADEGTAQELLEQIRQEKLQLVKEGKLKKSALTDSVIYKGDDNKYWEKNGKMEKDITNEIPFEIPDSWYWIRLNNLCNITNGFTPLRTELKFWENGNINWFTVEDIRKQGEYIYETTKKITELAVNKDRIVRAGSVLLCCTASVGQCAMTMIPTTTNQQFNALTVKEEYRCIVNDEFLFLFAKTLEPILHDLAGKTTFEFISVKKVGNILIPIPPVLEQHRICKVANKAIASIMRRQTDNSLILSCF